MYRTLVVMTLCAAMVAASTNQCSAQGAWPASRGAAVGGPLARLNKSFFPTLPGLPTASPLGLIAPRLSNAVSIFQKGGLRTPAGRLSAIGVVSPRISPLVALFRTPPVTRQAKMMYGLAILSPRAAVLVGMLKASRGLAAGLR
jgi:hypothetical protein